MARPTVPALAGILSIACMGGDSAAPEAPRLSHDGVPPPAGENVVWHAQFPDIVGTDIEFQERDGRTYAFVASMGTGIRIFDVTDGAHPVPVGVYASSGYQNDIQAQGTLAILATDLPPDPRFPTCTTCGTFEGIELIDVSNLSAPVKLADLATDGGAHNSTLIGSVAYLSNPSRDAIDVVDVTDPRTPRVVLRLSTRARCGASPYPCKDLGQTGWDPHDVTAQTTPDKGHRLYVGAIDATFILDVNEPRKARVVSKIPNGDFAASYQNIEISHQADPSPDGRLLVVSDERGGGVEEVTCPGGGLHVYDITSEANPKKLGVYFANYTGAGNCTAHNFRFLPDRNVLTLGWYSAGTWVVDLSGPPGAGEIDNSAVHPGQKTTWGRTLGFAIMPGADTWAAKSPGLTPQGRLFIFTDDITRGMDVFEFVGALPE